MEILASNWQEILIHRNWIWFSSTRIMNITSNRLSYSGTTEEILRLRNKAMIIQEISMQNSIHLAGQELLQLLMKIQMNMKVKSQRKILLLEMHSCFV